MAEKTFSRKEIAELKSRFSKKGNEDLQKAVHRYNSMLGLYRATAQKAGMDVSFLPEKINANVIREQSITGRALRSEINYLKSFKTISDFEMSQMGDFAITKGEQRVLIKAEKAQNRKEAKRIAELEALNIGELSTKELKNVQEELASLKREKMPVSAIKTAEGARGRLATYRAMKKSNIDSRIAWAKQNFIKELEKIENETGLTTKQIIAKIKTMSLAEYSRFRENHGDMIYELYKSSRTLGIGISNERTPGMVLANLGNVLGVNQKVITELQNSDVESW